MCATDAAVVIIQVDAEHLELVVPLFDAYRQFYQQPSNLQGSRSFLRARLALGDSAIFLALRDQQALGFTQLYPSFSSVAMRRLWILNDLFVRPEVRGQGIAQLLLERARQHALATGAAALLLETAADNPAQHLYERLGWQRDQQFYHYVLRLPDQPAEA